MLMRRFALLAAALVSVLGVIAPAYAGMRMGPLPQAVVAAGPTPPVATCPIDSPDCQINGTLPGAPGSPGGGPSGGSGGSHTCTSNGQVVPCYIDGVGRFNPNDGCYYRLASPQMPSPDGSPGAWYTVTCLGGGGATSRNVWLHNPPPGVGPSPAQLAQQALAKIRLLGAKIGIAPQPRGSGLAGLPVWMSTVVTPSTWGPISASDSAGGLTVTITAQARRIVWTMGSPGTCAPANQQAGSSSCSCPNPGTPYAATAGDTDSPTCGFRYLHGSTSTAHPHARFTVTATTYWEVDWAGGGESGVINTTRQSQTSVEIQELQVLTQ
jgi:hypothetical protein